MTGLCLAAVAHMAVGPTGLTPLRVLQVLLAPDGSVDAATVHDIRLPRLLLCGLVGANLAVAGVLIQTLTRNPLASPQTFGINAGAAFAIVLSLILWPGLGVWGMVPPAMAGAVAIGIMIWFLSLVGSMTPLKLALAGITLQLVLAALVQAMLIASNTAQDIVYWMAGSVSSAQWAKVRVLLPFTFAGAVLALAGSHHFGLLALDSSSALSLGQNSRRTGGLAACLIVALVGPSVAVSGPIGFVGLMVPHMLRRLVGSGMAELIGFSLIAGPLLVIAADLTGKLLIFPSELPVGIVTALLGAPAFLLITWSQRQK